MASFVYTRAKLQIARGEIIMHSQDIRAMLVKTSGNTTTDTEEDITLMNGFATLGELVATNYVRKALANEATNEDTGNDRAEFDADDIVWSSLGGETNDTIGALLVYKHVTNDTDSIPIAYIELTDTTTNGGDITVAWNVEGIIQLT